MSLETLKEAIKVRAEKLRGEKLLSLGVSLHKKNWKDCSCSWCKTKQRATEAIAHVGFPTGLFGQDVREEKREILRVRFRKQLEKEETNGFFR